MQISDRNFTTKETKKFKVLLMALAHTGDYEGVQKAYETGIRINVIGSRHFYPLVVALTVRFVLEFIIFLLK